MLKKNDLCVTCDKKKYDAKTIFCEKHKIANKMLKETYGLWVTAYDFITWTEYIKKLYELEEKVGKTIRDILEYELYFKAS